MWYSSSWYQIRPYCDVPVPHVSEEKSSVNEDKSERTFALVLAIVFEFTFRFAKRKLLLFELASRLLLLLLMLAIARTRMTRPIPMNMSTAPIPRIHGQTLRFCGTMGGIGDQTGGGIDAGG